MCIILHAEEFAKYLKYTRQLDFYEMPDYDYLRQMFANVMKRNDWSFDWVFDWTSHSQVRYWPLILYVSAYYTSDALSQACHLITCS